MGKGDAKKDYYAALGVAPNADLDTIKKRFRVLALQVHPDRNFGKGKEVTEKFVEVQEAYEVLSDQEQRAKYDTDRAKYLRKTQPDAFPFKRAQTAKVPPQNAAFQPTPKSRNASVDRSQFTSPRTKQSSASAEKFAAFTRAAPQTWDRVKFEQAAAQQEALRNFQSMRSQATQQSSKAGRAPTAPKTTNPVTSPDYAQPSMPSPGFPGLSRTHSTSRRQGFSPAVPGDDEPQAKSAYAYVNRDRDNTRSYHNATPQPPPPTSPTYSNMRTGSPLKPSRSSPGLDDGQRPTFGRSPSRYASTTGERTNINGVGIGRSASVRQSPVDRGLGERGPFGARAQASQEFMPPPPRHHSASPKLRPARDVRFQFSASESSSSGDDVAPPEPRRMAKPRRPRPPPAERATSNDPALMGQFTDKNYNRVVDENQYNFPPPEMSSAPHVQSPRERQKSWTDIADGMRATGLSNHDQEFPKPRRPSSSLHESSRGSPSRYENRPAPFRASEWDGKFADGENVFTPNERDRKSPTKNSRSRQPGKSREPPSEVYGDEDNVSPTTVPGNHPSSEAPSRNTTSSKGPFSMDGWAENLTSTGSTNTPAATASETAAFGGNFQGEGNVKESRSASMPDPMDIDSNGPESTREIPSIKVQPSSRRASAQGVDLSDLADTFPLKPSADGLNSLSSDLASSLPFKSRPAEQVQLFGPSGAALRGMSLPKPPKPIIAPEQEQITQESWESYWKKMQQYMRDWSAFNTKMIDHFRWRQEQVDHDMYRNWVMGEGEGANAQDMDGSDITSPPGSSAGDHPHKHVKAGYHTYMQWLEQDALCRNWWDAAVEEHRECLTELGRMRRTVKAIRDRQGGPD